MLYRRILVLLAVVTLGLVGAVAAERTSLDLHFVAQGFLPPTSFSNCSSLPRSLCSLEKPCMFDQEYFMGLFLACGCTVESPVTGCINDWTVHFLPGNYSFSPFDGQFGLDDSSVRVFGHGNSLNAIVLSHGTEMSFRNVSLSGQITVSCSNCTVTFEDVSNIASVVSHGIATDLSVAVRLDGDSTVILRRFSYRGSLVSPTETSTSKCLMLSAHSVIIDGARFADLSYQLPVYLQAINLSVNGLQMTNITLTSSGVLMQGDVIMVKNSSFVDVSTSGPVVSAKGQYDVTFSGMSVDNCVGYPFLDVTCAGRTVMRDTAVRNHTGLFASWASFFARVENFTMTSLRGYAVFLFAAEDMFFNDLRFIDVQGTWLAPGAPTVLNSLLVRHFYADSASSIRIDSTVQAFTTVFESWDISTRCTAPVTCMEGGSFTGTNLVVRDALLFHDAYLTFWTFYGCIATVADSDVKNLYLAAETTSHLTITNSTLSYSSMVISSGSFLGMWDSVVKVDAGVATSYAIVASSSRVDFVNSHFIGAPADGAIGVLLANEITTVTVESCTFSNLRGGRNGPISIIGLSGAAFSNSSFTNCTAQDGGAIYASTAELWLANCVFAQVTALSGGGLSLLSSTALIQRTTFTNDNFAGNCGTGGFITAAGDSNLHILSNSFVGGMAGVGGAIYLSGTSNVTISNSSFSECFADTSGGAIQAGDRTKLLLRNCQLERNRGSSSGGAISVLSYANVTLVDVVFSNNTTPSNGGALHVDDYAHCFAENCHFVGNRANSSAGAVAIRAGAHGFISSSSFEDNSAQNSGGAFSGKQYSSMTIQGSNFTGNSATGGGAVSLTDNAALEVTDCRVSENYAVTNGGAFVLTGNSRSEFVRVLWTNNTAVNLGGALVMAIDSSVVVTDSTIQFNEAKFGGSLFAGTSGFVGIESSEFLSNRATDLGGAVLVAGGRGVTDITMLRNSSFVGNVAKDGGGLAVKSVATVEVRDCFFSQNVALRGGGISVGGQSNVTVVGSHLDVNHAWSSGGAMYGSEQTHSSVVETSFFRNRASIGGALVFHGVGVGTTFKSCQFLQNSGGTGGAVTIGIPPSGRGSIQFQDCGFHENDAVISGGAVSFSLMAVTRESDGVPVDTQYGHSRVVAVEDDPLPTKELTGAERPKAFHVDMFVRCNLTYNSAMNGGAVTYPNLPPPRQAQLPLFSQSCQFIGNQASHFGGALFFPGDGYDQKPFLNAAHLADKYAFAPPCLLISFVFRCALLLTQRSSAGWAGSNFAWMSYSSNMTGCEVCTHCSFGPCNGQGYGLPCGAASFPMAVDLLRPCPNNETLDADSFNVTAVVSDAFGSIVKGDAILGLGVEMNASVVMGSLCAFQDEPKVVWDTASGLAWFGDLDLAGKQDVQCLMQFSALMSESIRPVTPDLCNTRIDGCSAGYEVIVGDPWDTCGVPDDEPAFQWWTLVLLASVVGLLCLVIVVYSFLAVFFQRRYLRKKRAIFTNLEIDDVLENDLTLWELLDSPDIKHIPWSELEVKERIGVGAMGIVSRGLWYNDTSGHILFMDSEMDVMRAGRYVNGSWESDEYLDTAMNLSTTVAVKELFLPTHEMDSKSLEEFIFEIKLMSALGHPSIVKFLGVAYDDLNDALYLVTEIMERGSLSDVLHRKAGNLSYNLKLKMCTDAAKGMVYLHRENIIHRDLKTQNLLVNSQWDCKVSDFGISTVKSATRTMTCIGTPLYMAPEVLRHSRYSEKADVYSFGIVLVEVITEKPVYWDEEDMNDAQLMYRVVAEGLRPTITGLASDMQQLVRDCLSDEPDMRPPFSEIVTRLSRISRKTPQAGSGMEELSPAGFYVT